MFDYFYANESEQYLFLQMPLMLIKHEQFKNLSDGAKILYSLLLNRTNLSAKNGWMDEQGRVYIIYTIEDIMTDLNCWEKKATKAMKELRETGLIRSVRRGLGKPNILYVMNFATALKHQYKNEIKPEKPDKSLNCQKDNSRIAQTTIQELSEAQSINIDSSNNNIESMSSHSQCQTEQEAKTDKTLTSDNDQTSSGKIIILKNAKASAITPIPTYQQTEAEKINQDDYNTYRNIIQENIEYEHLTYQNWLVDNLNATAGAAGGSI